jgi:hypothetical protein
MASAVSFSGVVLSVVICAALTSFLSVSVLRAGGKLLGLWLRRKTAAGRHAILTRAAAEEDCRGGQGPGKAPETGDRDRIERDAADSMENGPQSADGWQGIIGFFHPFW